MRPISVCPVLLLILLLSSCAAPLAGTWRGTFDHGPVAARPLTLHVSEDGKTAWLDLSEPGKVFKRFTICSATVNDQRGFELIYDAFRPNCDVPNPADPNANRDPSERRVLRGEVGDAVLTGEMFREKATPTASSPNAAQSGSERLGFFRAFRDGESLPEAETTTVN